MAEKKARRGLGLTDFVLLVVVGVVVVIVAFWVLASIAGFIWGLVKLAVLIGIIAVVVYLLLVRRRR
jgi:hypothetical protein